MISHDDIEALNEQEVRQHLNQKGESPEATFLEKVSQMLEKMEALRDFRH